MSSSWSVPPVREKMMNLLEIAIMLRQRLSALFLRDGAGKR